LASVPGRFEFVDAGQPFTVVVDYAHTPDGLAAALAAARELGERVIVVFGCGGDRDRGKRPLMGAVAAHKADLAVLTSDNPRSEDPLTIIEEVRAGAPGARNLLVEPDRAAAIALALGEARAGDVVLIAGKGHETGQVMGDETRPFDDRDAAREALS
jgi:UDP-N-acetylmuramoyl-L-alanyl-D-glutamate--2,6-diaminopimelate ligase